MVQLTQQQRLQIAAMKAAQPGTIIWCNIYKDFEGHLEIGMIRYARGDNCYHGWCTTSRDACGNTEEVYYCADVDNFL